MAVWQFGLVLLGVVWALQALGTWIQMRHYRRVMGGISRQWSDGYLGAGNARSALGKGVILILVVGPDEIVRRLVLMEGRSIFARFEPRPEFEGMRLQALRDRKPLTGDPKIFASKGFKGALKQAVDQIDRVRQRTGPDAMALRPA